MDFKDFERERKKTEMENEIRVDEDRAIDVEKIIADLKEKGLLVDDIKKALEQMLKEGTINEEEFAKAQELLKNEEVGEKEKAKELFGF